MMQNKNYDLTPMYAWNNFGHRIIVVMTLKEDVDGQIKALFDKGFYTEAVKMDQAAVHCLFELEKNIRDKIRVWCRHQGKHIDGCITDFHDLSSSELRDLIRKAQDKKNIGVDVNETGFLLPARSLCEVFLIENGIREDALSSCSQCARINCFYRNNESTEWCKSVCFD